MRKYLATSPQTACRSVLLWFMFIGMVVSGTCNLGTLDVNSPESKEATAENDPAGTRNQNLKGNKQVLHCPFFRCNQILHAMQPPHILGGRSGAL